MLDTRKITAATAVVAALALPATATAEPIPDAADGYRGLTATAADDRTGSLVPDAADGYRGLVPRADDSRTANAPSDAADGYGGLGGKQVETPAPDAQPGPADTRVTPVVHMIETSGEEFQWGDAGIGAAGGLAFIAIAGGIVLVATGRRRSTRRVASTS